MKAVFLGIWRFIYISFLVIAGIYILGMQFVPEELTNIIGYQIYAQMSDEMDPAIPNGSAVLVKVPEKGEEYEKDAILTFQAKSSGSNMNMTRRVESVIENGESVTGYLTKADNRERFQIDEVDALAVLGSYVKHIPFLGEAVLFLNTIYAVAIWAVLVLFLVIRLILKAVNNQDKKSKAKAVKNAGDTRFKGKQESLPERKQVPEENGTQDIQVEPIEKIQVEEKPIEAPEWNRSPEEMVKVTEIPEAKEKALQMVLCEEPNLNIQPEKKDEAEARFQPVTQIEPEAQELQEVECCKNQVKIVGMKRRRKNRKLVVGAAIVSGAVFVFLKRRKK